MNIIELVATAPSCMPFLNCNDVFLLHCSGIPVFCYSIPRFPVSHLIDAYRMCKSEWGVRWGVGFSIQGLRCGVEGGVELGGMRCVT